MSAQVQLRQAIDRQQIRLRESVPADRDGAIRTVLRGRDLRLQTAGSDTLPDLVTGRRLADLGGNKALQVCFEATDGEVAAGPVTSGEGLDDWAKRFLDECARLVEAELVLAHCETGFMRMVEGADGTLHAWIATKRAPTSWRERADIDWWAGSLARLYVPEPRALRTAGQGGTGGNPVEDARHGKAADAYLKMMGYQLGYPDDAVIGGCSIRMYRDVLGMLILWALQARDRGVATVSRSEQDVVATIAAALGVDPAVVALAVDAFTVDWEGAAYHAAVPGVAAAPLVRVAPDRVVWSVYGLTTEPLLFLARELRRRDARAYHNAAHLREGVFRQDIYALFPDKRFVTGTGRIELRREVGDVRTDVDAAVFDRKTGTLGLFELKSQDPFARSTAELVRQRDNVLYANRQISGVLDWVKRHGADALLERVDARTAKRFRVQKVFPFVLGRYLAHFGDGPEPDRRAAWGTWPQVLRLLDGEPVRATDANPIASLFSRLTKDVPLARPLREGPSREIGLGDARLFVHASYAAFQARTAGERGASPG